MQCELIRAGADAGAVAPELRALVPAAESVREVVAEIIERVRARGDGALNELTQRFDTGAKAPLSIRVEPQRLEEAATQLDPALRTAIDRAAANVRTVAEAAQTREEQIAVSPAGTEQVRLRTAPLRRAAIYVPGGRAPYPSTVVMGVVTAKTAEVDDVVVCCPPGRATAEIDSSVLAACKLTEATTVYRMGGAQAIAALAYGTESVAPVDVIVGPGNLFVQEAKRQVVGKVGIDGFAGPSDLALIADSQSDPAVLALDLLAQAEHGPGTLVVGISTDGALLGSVARYIEEAADTGAIARLVQVVRLDQALELAEELAPEHLQLVGPHAEGLAPEITRAGCLFVGPVAGTAFGDYIAGSNHVLPTGGAARFASGLSPADFRRSFNEVRISDATELAQLAAPLARAEGFELHARSMEARIRENE